MILIILNRNRKKFKWITPTFHFPNPLEKNPSPKSNGKDPQGTIPIPRPMIREKNQPMIDLHLC